MTRWVPRSLLLLLVGTPLWAQEVPREGPARLAAIRRQLSGTVSKFAFTQGYDFGKKPELLRPFLQAIKDRGFDTWDQPGGRVWNERELQALERTLQVAGEVGLRVWATLSPPSESDELARLPLAERREYYYATAEQFARLALKYPQFTAFTCDDFSLNSRFFRPEMLAEMARRWRAVCPRLAFVPLLYYPGVTERFFRECGPYVDGIVFHFRAESYPPALIPAYDPRSFEMYGDAMRYELKKVRQMAGQHPVICGIYIWYYERGWGVMTADGQRPDAEHTVRDALQKITIAHDDADGLRVYGLGIGHEAYGAMGELAGRWRSAGQAWGGRAGEPESHLARWQTPPADRQFLGTLLQSDRGLGHDLPARAVWPRWEVLQDLQRERFLAPQAVQRHPLLLVSRSALQPQWEPLLEAYVRAGGILVLEFVPGWSPALPEAAEAQHDERGEQGKLTQAIAGLAGISFRYEPRGFATRWRVLEDHPLTKGLPAPGLWQATVQPKAESNYPYLVYPVTAAGSDVLVEVEHERCRYDGRSYVRQGKPGGTHPLLTVHRLGRGIVIRHYAAVDPAAVFGAAYEKLLENLVQLAAGRDAARPAGDP